MEPVKAILKIDSSSVLSRSSIQNISQGSTYNAPFIFYQGNLFLVWPSEMGPTLTVLFLNTANRVNSKKAYRIYGKHLNLFLPSAQSQPQKLQCTTEANSCLVAGWKIQTLQAHV